MSNTSKRLHVSWVDAAKGLSIILVVLYHTHYWLNEANISTSSPWRLNEALAEMRMPMFFFAAGLFAAKYIAGTWRNLLVSKIVLLGWVLLVWQAISSGYSFLAGVALFGDSPVEALVKAVAKIPLTVIRPGNELWFLWALCLMFVLCKVALRLPWQARVAVALVPAIVLQAMPAGIEGTLVSALGIGWLGLGRYFVFFLAATLLGRDFAERVESAPRWLAVAGLVVSAPLVVLSQYWDAGLGNFLFMFAGLTMGVCGALLLSWIKPLRTLGANTLPVYVMHTSALVVIVVALSDVTDITDLGPLWPALIALAVTVLASFIYQLLKRTKAVILFEPPARVTAWADQRIKSRAR